MKADRAAVERALASPAPTHNLVLLYGPDEAGSRSLMALASARGGERVTLSGADLKSDPARLADEAASLSLFGEARHIVVEPAGDEVIAAVTALLDVGTTCNQVIIVAGALKPTSKLLKAALASKRALALASYMPDGRAAPRLVQDLAHQHGLSVRLDVAQMISDGAAGNRAVIAQELAKIALYLDSASDRPQTVDHDVIAAIGAGGGEGDLSRLVDAVCNGDSNRVDGELLRLSNDGIEGITAIRGVARRLTLLAELRAEVDAGKRVDGVVAARGRAIFWKDKDAVTVQVSRWPAETIARAIGRLLAAERSVKSAGGLGPLGVNSELFAISRQAARMR